MSAHELDKLNKEIEKLQDKLRDKRFWQEKLAMEDRKARLDQKPLALALWWYIENVNENDPLRTETFFYLRERVRKDF